METLIVKPRNKKELQLVATLMKRMDIPVDIQTKKAIGKKKSKTEFLDSLEGRLKEVKLHEEGKIKLKSWDELYQKL